MSATRRAVGAIIAATILLTFVGVATFQALGQVRTISESRRQTAEVIEAANGLLASLRDAETGERGYALTGDPAFLAPYLAVREKVHGDLVRLGQLAQNRPGYERMQHLLPLVEARLLELAHVVELRQRQEVPAMLAAVSGGEGKRLMDAIRIQLGSYITFEADALRSAEASFQRNLQRLFAFIVLASGLGILSALGFAALIHRHARHQQEAVTHLRTKGLLKDQEALSDRLQATLTTLQVSEEKLFVTLNSIGDAVIATDALGRIVLLNPRAELLTGWSQPEAEGHPIEEVFRIINLGTRLPSLIPVHATLARGTMQALANDVLLIARDGSECAIADSCAPIRDRAGSVVGAVLVFRDVTSEYVAHQAANDSTALIQTILNTVVDGIITLRASDTIIETINPAAERMFGYGHGELIGQPFSLLIPELDREQNRGFLEYYSASLKEKALGAGHEVEGRRRDGSIVPLEIAITDMRLAGERYFTGIFRDITARKLAEDALLKGGALQNAIFNSANFSSIATDSRGVIQIFNVGAERMLGYRASEVINKITPADISDPDEVIVRALSLSQELETTILPGFEALVFKASRGIEDIYELTYIRKDGSRFPAVVSVTALRDDLGAIIGYLLIGTDNTARKQAEEALLQAGALQSAIFNSANFSSIATDAKGVIQIFNVGAERMLGFAAADVMNLKTPADISDSKEIIIRATALTAEFGLPIAPGFEALVFKAARGIEDIYELTYIRKDGTRFPAVVSVTALRDDQAAIIGYLLIGTDNTARRLVEAEQRRLEQRLRDSQFYARSLFESNVDALVTTDPAGFITDTNKQMEELTGCTRDELIGAPFGSHFTDPDRAEASIHLVLREKRITNYELTTHGRGGRETVVSFNATTFFDRDRNLQGVFGAARDVTEAKRLDLELLVKNVELESARAAAEKANQAKSEFLSSMSHELRSPLNAILGFAQLMESEPVPPTPDQQESLSQILRAGWHLLKLIDQILDLAKVESGGLPLHLEPVSMAEVMYECQSLIELQAQQRGIRVTFPPFDEPCFVRADHTRVKQVVINLLSNAIKYNMPQGEVDVACWEILPGRIRISIRDTGPGLSQYQVGQLFQAFNRLGQEGRGQEGTGIGLVVAKRLVELMGGVVGVESTVGLGSEFWFELFADSPSLGSPNEEPSAVIQPGRTLDSGRRTVLYVEDNGANLKLVEQIIGRHEGLHLLTATTGWQGLEVAREVRPDLILMDINLPDLNGFEVLETLRSDPHTAQILVIALSANAMPHDIERAMRAGFFRYLTKPIKLDEFLEAMEEAFAATSSVRPSDGRVRVSG